MPYSAEQRRNALKSFMDANELQPKAWARAAGLSESSLWPFLSGKKTKALGDDTYEKLADAATELLHRQVTASELRGDPVRSVQIPLYHHIGAGDAIHVIDDNGPIDYVDGPPGFEGGGAGKVQGDSMAPVYEDGDILYWKRLSRPPKEPPKRAVIVKVKDGPLYLKKLLPGTKKGHYHLVSINPITQVLIDQPVEAIARVEWVHPAR